MILRCILCCVAAHGLVRTCAFVCKCVCVCMSKSKGEKGESTQRKILFRRSDCKSSRVYNHSSRLLLNQRYSAVSSSFLHMWNRRRWLILRCIVATIPLGVQQGQPCKHDPSSSVSSEYCLNRWTRGKRPNDNKETKEKRPTTNTMAVVVEICRLRGRKDKK